MWSTVLGVSAVAQGQNSPHVQWNMFPGVVRQERLGPALVQADRFCRFGLGAALTGVKSPPLP
jgi:hypothetical protein